MTETQQCRAKALQIAVQLLGQLPKGSNLESESTYQDYLCLADRIEQYIKLGGTILTPKTPDGGSNSSVTKAEIRYGSS